MKKIILLILSILLLIPFASAYTVDIKWDSDLDDYNQRVYHCTDAICSNVDKTVLETSTQTDKTSTFFTAEGTQYHAVYFYKEGYVPKAILLKTWGDFTTSKKLEWHKKNEVKAEINSVTLSNEPKVGEETEFKVTVESAFHSSEGAQGTPAYIPADLIENYYSSKINVIFSIYNQKENTMESQNTELNIPMDSQETTKFTFTPKIAGTSVAIVTTQVTDDQVESYNEQTTRTPFTITPSDNPTDNAPDSFITSPENEEGFYLGVDPLKLDGYGKDDGEITAYSWTLEHESGVKTTENTQTVTNIFLQLAGTWKITFNVQDDAGQWDPTPAQVKIEVKEKQVEQFDPKVKIDAPFEGEVIKETYKLMWTATDENQNSNTLGIELKYRKISNTFSEAIGSILETLGIDSMEWNHLVSFNNNPGSYEWYTSNVQNGHYEIQVIVIDNTNRYAKETVQFWINNGVVIEDKYPFAIINYNLRENLEVRFDASDSYDTDGRIVGYEWNFGDGTTASGSRINHVYDISKSYTVTLTVTDNDGLTNTKSVQVTPTGPASKLTKADHKFSINNVIPKQTDDAVNLYINLENKGLESDKIELVATYVSTGESSRMYLTLDQNEDTWEWLTLSKPDSHGKYVVRIEAKSSGYDEITYTVVTV